MFDYPENWLPASDVYEFDIFNKKAFKNEKPLQIRIKILEQTNNLKKIFFWNGVLSDWVELPSEVGDAETMKSILHLPYAKMVVLGNKNILQIGDASWYGYKGCLCAASPDYEKGTKLNVKDLDSGKEVVVKVNDYGPDRSLFPNRVIDLDKIAFQKLGKLSWGVLHNILVTKVN
ncbi:septal ring lytic transglycosylase RlpA family protein [Patescibacteria group bacterium]|nr:septal ring lytic transglycosylase RlpA family protein [Patescibacteria group bacterium]